MHIDGSMQIQRDRTLTISLLEAAAGSSGIHFISSRSEQERVDYADLRDRAIRLLGELQRFGAVPGNEVVLQVRNDRDFLISF